MLNVVFVPGLGLTGFEWHAVRIHLGDAVDQARAIALPSLGEPVVPGTELGVDAAADRVAASISGDEPPVVLVGHSAGCAVAVATAVRCPSVAGLVAWKAGVSPGNAATIAAVAHRASEFPLCTEALRGGRLSLDQVGVIASRAADGSDEHYAQLASVATVNQLRTAVALEPRPDPEPARPPRRSIVRLSVPAAANVAPSGSVRSRCSTIRMFAIAACARRRSAISSRPL